MTVVNLSQEAMRRFEESAANDPAIAKLNEITVEVAERRGGLVLEYYGLAEGRLFGLPWMMTGDDVTRRLGVQPSEVPEIAEAGRVINERWFATREWKASRFAEMRERWKEGLPTYG